MEFITCIVVIGQHAKFTTPTLVITLLDIHFPMTCITLSDIHLALMTRGVETGGQIGLACQKISSC